MKFLIFGGTGFIGASLYDYIKENGGEVISVARSGESHTLELDVGMVPDFRKIDFQPDVVVNCASRIPAGKNNSKDPEFLKELFTTNVIGAVNICNWAVSKAVPKIINCSTLATVKKPWPKLLLESSTDLPEGFHVGYAMSKLCQEQIMNEVVANSETKLLHLRLSSVYGKSMAQTGIIYQLLNTLQKNENISLTNAHKTEFDFIHVNDVCKVIYRLSIKKTDNDLINLASGTPISLIDLAILLKELTMSASKINNTDSNTEVSNALISTNKLEKYIGTMFKSFTPLKEGLRSLINKASL